jgi:hypothetical protein
MRLRIKTHSNHNTILPAFSFSCTLRALGYNGDMKIWMGKFCLLISTCTLVLLTFGCTSVHERSSSDSSSGETSLKEDQDKLNEMRKDIPEETKKSNDRLGEMLKRWKDDRMPPDRLRDKFSDEIRKQRTEIEKRHKREREDFTRGQQDKRKAFQEKQKDAREDFLSSKPKPDKREQFISRQGEDRDRFNSDARDARDEFEENIRDQRKEFESDISDRWSEFRGEYPEYVKAYNEAKAAEEKKREEAHPNAMAPPPGMPAPVTGAPPPYNVNQGGDGWPATDPSD